MSKDKAYIEKNDIVDKLRQVTRLAEYGYISFIDESNEGNEMKLIIKIKEKNNES